MTAPPPPTLLFRISTYFTLLAACLALGYSEYDLVPESLAFLALVVVSLAASFFLEGRVSLGLGKANLLGLGIGLVAIGWLAVKLTRSSNSALAHLPWPANLLPYIGPLVMILIPAKLFRPKHIGDWWTMHGIGLVAVVLASSMTDDPFFLVLVVLYSVGAIWSLSVFFSNRSTGAIPTLPGRVEVRPEILGGASPGRWGGERGLAWRAILWLAVASAVALPIFFLSPRSTGERWAFTKSRLETGYNPESAHDMNKIGDLENNMQVAFEVEIVNRDGGPLAEIEPSRLWRGTSYSDYDIGRWLRGSYRSGHGGSLRLPKPPEEYVAPDLGPTQYDLEFHGGEKVSGPVLSSPICWADRGCSPVSSVVDGWHLGWSLLHDGSFVAPKRSESSRLHYTQRTCAPCEAGLGTAMQAFAFFDAPLSESEQIALTQMRIPRIREWAIELLKKCVAAGRLPQAVLDTADQRVGFAVRPEHHESVARVFEDYFLNSGEFEYSAKLRRIDKKIDPIEDFLWNARTGHCERFASALALALRGLGIPAQFVIGFKGYDRGDGSKLLIRQEHAHAWVEVLVSRPAPPGFMFDNPQVAKANRLQHWLSLDATPGTFASTPSGGNWFDTARQKSVSFVNDFIIGYNPAKRERAVESVNAGIQEWAAYPGGVLAIAVVIVMLRRRFTGHRAVATADAGADLAWYRRFLSVLKRHGYSPAAGQTPKEFADGVSALLRTTPASAASAVPPFVTSKLYRVRYAGAPLTPAEERDVLAALATLEAALRT